MKKVLFIVYSLLFFGACSTEKLYTIRTFESNWPWETIAVLKDKNGNVKMLQLYRNDSLTESRFVDFYRNNDNQYSSLDGNQKIEFQRSLSILHIDSQHIGLLKIKNSPIRSNRKMVESLLDENYIVHANIHQTTFFDCRKDSYCYLLKNDNSVPFDTSKWHLFELNDELFLSYTATQRGFHRVFAENGNLVFTSCTDPNGINVHKAVLKSKIYNNL